LVPVFFMRNRNPNCADVLSDWDLWGIFVFLV
jgi:hypothetical protein